MKLFAISPGATANVNIGIFPGNFSLDQLDVQAKLGLTSVGAKNIHTENVHFPFGRAVEGTYTLPINGSSAPIHGTQFYASHGGRTYVTTFSGKEKSLETGASSTMMRSWRFTS